MIKGVYTALITPFDDKGDLDRKGICTNVHRQIEGGVDGLLVLGTTGEAATLSAEEREIVITEVVKAVDGVLPVMVGVGTNCTRTTVEAAKRAKDLGASSLLVVVPYYNCPEPEGIYRHIETVSAATDLPICLYHHPKRTGCRIEIDTAKVLTALPKVVAWKDCSGDQGFVDQLLQSTMSLSNFTVLTGNDESLLSVMALGGDGVISAVSNLIPESVVALVRSAEEGNFSAARRWHRELSPIVRAAFLESNPSCIKAMMHQIGLPAGVVRLPLTMPTMRTQKELRSVVAHSLRAEILL